MKDVTAKLADHFKLTESEREDMLPSGNSRVIVNRVGWAKIYLKEAGLVQPVKWGVIQITPEGLAVLAESPAQIDMNYLERFNSFVEFLNRKRTKKLSVDDATPTETTVTPDEQIVEAYQEMHNALADELLQQVMEMTDRFFERLVVDLLVAMG